MSGFSHIDQRARGVIVNVPKAFVEAGDMGWQWIVAVEGKSVQVEITGQVLRTVANRAAKNKSGRASQGGITAKVMKR